MSFTIDQSVECIPCKLEEKIINDAFDEDEHPRDGRLVCGCAIGSAFEIVNVHCKFCNNRQVILYYCNFHQDMLHEVILLQDQRQKLTNFF